MKKNILGILLLLFAISSCGTRSERIVERLSKKITLNSTGNLSVKPDEANLTIKLKCLYKNIQKSKTCIVNESEKFNSFLLGYGIEVDDIITTSINISKKYEWRLNKKNIFLGYLATMTSSITIRDLSILEEIYTELFENENISIGNLYFSHSKIDSLNNEAYLIALDNANNLADDLIKKMKMKKLEVINIENISFENNQNYYFNENISNNYFESDSRPNKIKINNGIMNINRKLIVEYKFR